MITEIESHGGKSRIYFDGICRMTVRETDVRKANIQKGDELDPEECSEKIAAQQYNACYEAALCLLDVSAQTEKGIITKLIRKGYMESVANSVAQRLRDIGLINEESYAHSIIRGAGSKSIGRIAIKRKMLQKGLDPEIVEDALTEIDSEQEHESCRKAYLDALRKYAGEEDKYKKKQKIAGYLMRKGFTWDTCSDVIESTEAE